MDSQSIIGVLLAGGLSRRMGGGDKCLRMLAGRPMLDHIAASLAPQCAGLVINANGDPARFAAFGLPVVPDTVAGYAGPLAGVLAGMRWASANARSASWIATVSTDAPLLPPDLVSRLRAALHAAGPASRIALARSDGNLHPVIGLWPTALADDLEAALASGTRKVLAWTDRHGTVPVDFPMLEWAGGKVDPFFNVNTPEDLEDAERILSEGRS